MTPQLPLFTVIVRSIEHCPLSMLVARMRNVIHWILFQIERNTVGKLFNQLKFLRACELLE
ncbi:Hypothetical protein CINCED_3A022250 [Cinara cedri]|uniref:Uncharacterized protein n=1 Tax=Cinara cedri TaxID=506608 RepID=A0A5E4N9V5_9HEMI|nr:Hypothetical protein CINCED_3A022250 [Cinara cedri]